MRVVRGVLSGSRCVAVEVAGVLNACRPDFPVFVYQAEGSVGVFGLSRGVGNVYKRQVPDIGDSFFFWN